MMAGHVQVVVMAAFVAAFMSGCASSGSSGHFSGAGDAANVYVAPGHQAIKKVAVMPFKAPTELIGVSVSDQVLTELLHTGRYELVERGRMAQVLGEQELSLAGLSVGRATEVGAMLGADGVIIGTVSEYERMAHRGKSVPVVAVSIRLIDTQNGRIVWSAELAQRASGASETLSAHSRSVVHQVIGGLFTKMRVVQ